MALACSLVLGQAAYSDSMCGKGIKKMLDTIKLDEAQKEKVKPFLEQQASTMKELGGQMQALDTKLDEQMNSAQPDQSAIDGMVDQKVKLIGQMIKTKISTKVQIFGVLNTDQRSQLQGMLKKTAEKIAEKYKECHQDD